MVWSAIHQQIRSQAFAPWTSFPIQGLVVLFHVLGSSDWQTESRREYPMRYCTCRKGLGERSSEELSRRKMSRGKRSRGDCHGMSGVYTTDSERITPCRPQSSQSVNPSINYRMNDAGLYAGL